MAFHIRQTSIKDSPIILQFIKDLSVYEKLSHEVSATLQDVEDAFFRGQSTAEVLLGEEDGIPVVFAIYFYNFSSFLSRKGLYLEDLFVKPEYRGKGYGKKMLLHLVHLAKERKCGRMEWIVLDWNESAIQFYKSLGAHPRSEWTTFRLDKEAIDKLTP